MRSELSEQNAERTPEERRDDPYELYCPACGHDGVFDGQGTWTEKASETRSGLRTKYSREWYQFHCGECGSVFRVLEHEEEIDQVVL